MTKKFKSHKKKRITFIGAILAISIAALLFVIFNFRENIVFFYAPSELKTPEIVKKTQGHKIRIGGLVKDGSINKINVLNARFVVTDLQSEVVVSYHGILPNLFREKQGVVASGTYDFGRNEFFSEELLIKHDENYMPPEVAKTLKR